MLGMTTSTPVGDLNPSRVLVCGDWHGNLAHMKAAVRAAEVHGCQVLVQVGDLGILWPGEHVKSFDLPLTEELAKRNITFVFADGNHDNHALLREFDPAPDGFVESLPGVWWAPRGHRWAWSGIKFAALGGAFSVDRSWRVEGTSVWAALEEPTLEEADRLGDEPIDVLLTHDVPTGVPFDWWMKLDGDVMGAAGATRTLLANVVEKLHPQIVFSGHHHQRVTHQLSKKPPVRVEVLHMDGNASNAVILELPSLEVTDLGWADPQWHLWTRRRERNAAGRNTSDRD